MNKGELVKAIAADAGLTQMFHFFLAVTIDIIYFIYYYI